jgi:hypothetical protein
LDVNGTTVTAVISYPYIKDNSSTSTLTWTDKTGAKREISNFTLSRIDMETRMSKPTPGSAALQAPIRLIKSDIVIRYVEPNIFRGIEVVGQRPPGEVLTKGDLAVCIGGAVALLTALLTFWSTRRKSLDFVQNVTDPLADRHNAAEATSINAAAAANPTTEIVRVGVPPSVAAAPVARITAGSFAPPLRPPAVAVPPGRSIGVKQLIHVIIFGGLAMLGLGGVHALVNHNFETNGATATAVISEPLRTTDRNSKVISYSGTLTWTDRTGRIREVRNYVIPNREMESRLSTSTDAALPGYNYYPNGYGEKLVKPEIAIRYVEPNLFREIELPGQRLAGQIWSPGIQWLLILGFFSLLVGLMTLWKTRTV